MTVIEDVTAVKTAELQTRVLADSGRILASSLDYEQTLRNVTEVAIPALADYCAVDLFGGRRQLQRVAASHRDADAGEAAPALRDLGVAGQASAGAAARVLLTGTSELYSDVTDDQLAEIAGDDPHLEQLRALAPRSVLIVPMRVAATTIGLMTLATDRSRRRLVDGDVELAEQLARRAAVAVENARLHTKLAAVAETLQQNLLPRDPPAIPAWEIAALYRPAEIEQRIDVGGDFYEFFECDGTWFLIFGDVSGKGVTAASLALLMRHGARFACRSDPAPSAILASLDEVLGEQAGDGLCTAICARLHGDHIVISSAGHPPAMLVDPAGGVRELPTPGPLLGAFTDSSWPEERVEINPGELLVLYTDGVTETPGTEERFGLDRFRALLAGLKGQSPAAVLAGVDGALDAFAEDGARDDVAALALRLK
jgi:serine phosphatase RsbU (regulator of sigma subunit)